MIDHLLKDNDHMRAIVRQFDETICCKVSKSEVKVLRETLEKRFINIDKW